MLPFHLFQRLERQKEQKSLPAVSEKAARAGKKKTAGNETDKKEPSIKDLFEAIVSNDVSKVQKNRL